MAYDASGKWQEQDESVGNRVAGLTSRDSSYMQQARSSAQRTSQRRGLLNSSIAASAGEDAAIRSALPIAQQEGQQAAQRNQMEANMANQRGMQIADNTAQMARLQEQGQITDRQQTADFTGRRGLLDAENMAMLERQRGQIASQEGMQGRDIASRRDLTQMDIDAQSSRLDRSIGSQERIAVADRANQVELQRIQQAGADRERALAASTSATQAYMQALSTISANEKIPAGTRDAYLQSMARQNDSNIALVEQLMGVDLQWASASTGTGAGGIGPGRATPPPTLQPAGPPQAPNASIAPPGSIPTSGGLPVLPTLAAGGGSAPGIAEPNRNALARAGIGTYR